ncbi:vesicle coat component [Knufia obscura]|uniref:Protein transport protein sec16 n=2 Tax=Knufia TaxID=430999 RepID=A0AAN8E8V2_9EURO|nr:vesicle coat component [Knufia obscura]KAK5947890.1 vesicle coat component [Knufia fluminis]
MDFSNFSHDGEEGFLTEQKESHWQPALRPNEDEVDQIPQPDTSMDDDTTAQSSQSRHFSHETDDSEEQQAQGGLDPAWGIKRTDTARLLDGVHRSASFPAPEPQQSTPSARLVRQSHVLKSSIVEEPAHSFSQTKPNAEDEQEILHSAHHAESPLRQEEQSLAQPDQISSRFEEGLPLISADQEPEPQTEQEHEQEQPPTVPAFNADEDDAANDFFSQVKDESHLGTETRPAFERKETADVLTGLGMQTAAPDSPPPTQRTTQPEPAKEKDFAAAFGDDFAEDTDLAAAFAQNQDPEDDPWKAVLEDDDGFLVEDADDLLPDSDEEIDSAPAPLPTRPAQPAAPAQRAPNYARSHSSYAPHQPTTSELTGFGPTTQHAGLPRQMQNPMNAFQSSQQRPNITNRAESFVDQSKGGYKSPYDLPMDLAPKKRVQAQRAAPPVNTVPPPPRTSSMNAEKQLQSPFSPSAPTFNQTATASPAALPPGPPIDRSGSVPVQSAQTASNRATFGFFEELPIVPRVRPAASARTPSVQTPAGPPRQSSMSNTGIVASPPQIQQPPPTQQQDPYAQFNLQQPAKLDPYAHVSLQPTQPAQAPLAPAPPAMPSRYSPAPPGLQNGIRPSPSPRYSPAPPSQAVGPRYSPAPPPQQANGNNRYASQPVPGTNLPFQPRTSSPLAQNRKSVDDSVEQAQQPRPYLQHTASSSLPYNPPMNSLSPPQATDPVKQPIVPPRRPQTQSPSRQMTRPGVPPRIAPPPNRPASAFGQLSPTRTRPPQNVLSPPRMIPQRPPVEELDYIQPTDGTEHDPLQRFKGAPVFRFGFGGTVVTSFPLRTPRYSTASRPQIKASPGEVKTRKFDSILNPTEHVSKFPGPLKGKAKKKDVLTWLSTAIGAFQNGMMSTPSKRLEEKLCLWKIVQILVESDGNLESPQSVQKASAILMPDVYALDDAAPTPYRMEDAPSSIYRPESFTAKSEAVDPVAIEKLRKTLLKGKREDAVWQAVDNRLWSHALLLASTLDKSVWKSVIAEFVKQEVKTMGSNADSLCALYEVLGGNTEESIDQLVPPSARAGLQMVSRVEASGPTRNALDGLDRWKETLCLILNNRSGDDQRALITLARLLTDYGRIEAAHICYLFARPLFGGADDPTAMVVLLGADHRNHPSSFHLDTDSVMLTEAYEFAVSTLAPGATGLQIPHLSVYKLQRARELTDAGMKTEAQAYCDVLEAGLKSSTKNSLYYNRTYQAELQDLSNRVRQIPVQSASWIAKPSIEKVSGSLLSKFSSFVTGEDSDAESKGSARDAAEAGPFANVSGSPTLSRNTSQTDLYGSYPAATQMTPAPAPTAAGSRYAPNGMNSARSSSEMARGRSSLDYQRSPPSSSHGIDPSRNIYAPVMQPQQNAYSPNMMSPPSTGYQANPYQPSPEAPMPSVAEESYPPTHTNAYAPHNNPYRNNMPQADTNGISSPPVQPAFGGYTPDIPQQSQFTPAPTEPTPSSTFEPSTSTSAFEPPSNDTGYGGYAPPESTGYQPYVPDADSDDEKPKPKKSFMNDDTGDFSRPSNTSAPAQPQAQDEAARKKANDAAAEAAFRAAAEADAADAKSASQKKTGSGSWGFGLGGLFGSKKNESLDAQSSKSNSADKKVHRVHLGESKMKLYYDKEKGKWINPDNPDAAEKKAAPPPPRSSSGSVPPMSMGPPRSVSMGSALSHSQSMPGMPALPGSRSGTPLSQAVDTGSEGGDSRPGTGHGPAPPPGIAATLPPGTAQSLGLGSGAATPGAGSGPPSRPASALSNASGLDDLLGPPSGGARKGGRTASGARGKKGRYVDVMAK